MSAPRHTPTTVAIDYDGTWTTDPVGWAAFSNGMRARGHRMLLVTARATGHADVRLACTPHVDRVIFTPGTPKRIKCLLEGEDVAIWIDDKPEVVDRVR